MTLYRLKSCPVHPDRLRLPYEEGCYECVSARDLRGDVERSARLLDRLSRQIDAAHQTLAELKESIAEKRDRTGRKRRARYMRTYRRRHRAQVNAYNREWMRAYRARQREAVAA